MVMLLEVVVSAGRRSGRSRSEDARSTRGGIPRFLVPLHFDLLYLQVNSHRPVVVGCLTRH